MSVIVTVEFSRDVDIETRESVQVRHSIYVAEDVTADQINVALRAFREALREAVPA